MHDEIVKIKGGRKGLQLSFAEGASFDDIWKHIEQKLESGSGFFLRGTLVLVPRERFLKEELARLQKLFHEHGLICRTMGAEDAAAAEGKPAAPAAAKKQKAAAPAARKKDPQVQEMVGGNRTLRAGIDVATDEH